jgi:hypothetical protein
VLFTGFDNYDILVIFYFFGVFLDSTFEINSVCFGRDLVFKGSRSKCVSI